MRGEDRGEPERLRCLGTEQPGARHGLGDDPGPPRSRPRFSVSATGAAEIALRDIAQCGQQGGDGALWNYRSGGVVYSTTSGS